MSDFAYKMIIAWSLWAIAVIIIVLVCFIWQP
jgi:hypothetical protein